MASSYAQAARRSALAVYGEEVTITRDGTALVFDPPLMGRFSGATQRKDTETGAMLDSAPRLSLEEEDLGDVVLVEEEDVITVRETDYIVREIRPDGEGLTVLILRETDA